MPNTSASRPNYNPQALDALTEALRHVFWFRKDLRRFLNEVGVPREIVDHQDWQNEYKVVIARNVLDALVELGDAGLAIIRSLNKAVLDIPNFDHLRRTDDADRKIQSARIAVEELRKLIARQVPSASDGDPTRRAFRKSVEQIGQKQREIERLAHGFAVLAQEVDHQRRGLMFEPFLYDLFVVFDLNPRGPFKIVGEQIDGAFELDGTQFLLEAKWEKDRLGVHELYAFAGKVKRRLENTLGLMISLNGYSKGGLAAFGKDRTEILLLDGGHLALTLQGIVDLPEILRRVKRHAAQTGDPYLDPRQLN